MRIWHAGQNGNGSTRRAAWTRIMTALLIVVFMQVAVIGDNMG